uniref:Epidermal growth factor receptor substrate 15-like 1 n=1 Tax=Syphacia muris TaxID=451379 RepID=A0A158R4P9_9BILA
MPSLTDISQQNNAIYENLYNEMNPQGKQMIPAQEAAAFLKRSNLSVQILGQIWELADFNKKGYLDKNGAFVALKLVAACQQGHAPLAEALSLSLDPPTFASRCATPSLPVFGNVSCMDKWVISTVEKEKYDSIFDSLNPIDGKVPGAKVRPVLLNSGLPSTSLAKLWELSDLDKDGQLNRSELSIALHLVYRALQGDPIPAVLPASLLHFSTMSPIAPPPSKQKIGRRSRTGSTASLDTASTSYMTSNLSLTSLQPRSQSVQPTATSTPVHVSHMSSLNLSSWPIQSMRYEQDFKTADVNGDGLVSGADIRDELLKSGLPQATLARLWALADVKKTGVLNLEQFSLIMYFIEQCKQGCQIPTVLPPNLIPPSMRLDEVPNISGLHISQDSVISSGNEELDAIQRDIRNLINERREADQAIVQLEADMTVKNSEVKNLQLELATLETTVAQLERQKIEAGRRLDALDNQITQLEQNGMQLKEKLREEESRLNALREKNQRNRENAEKEAEQIAIVQKELSALVREKNSLDSALAQRNSQIEMAANQLTEMEGQVANMEEKKKQMDLENEKLKVIAERLKNLVDGNDYNVLMKEGAELATKFGVLVSQKNVINGTHSTGALQGTTLDPFSGGSSTLTGANDPFGNDPFASTSSTFPAFDDVFGSQKDPFNSSDPFSASLAQTTVTQPFGNATNSKSPPPRPAPPKSKQPPAANADADPFVGSDPFRTTTAPPTNSGDQFADFANFSAFS